MIIKDKKQLKVCNFLDVFWLPKRREYETDFEDEVYMNFEDLEENKLYIVGMETHDLLQLCCRVDNYLIVAFQIYADLEQERKLFNMLKNEELSVADCLNFFEL